MLPSVIGDKYRLVREISAGGMGTVYEARHMGTGRAVALKLIRPQDTHKDGDGDRIRRFEREARAAGAIDSQHVVQVTDSGFDALSGRPYLVMELLTGEDLRALLRRARVLPTELVLKIASQVCLGLARAHERGVVHRDIKAANIFLSRRDDATVVVKILDFGIAKMREQPWAAAAQELTQSGAVIGSPSYMSPEQALGARSIDARTDLWSLGVVMYEALSGSTPHGRDLTLGALIVDICSRPAPPLLERAPAVPEEVATIVHRALALEPSQRFSSALEMHAAIRALVADDRLDESMLGPALSTEAVGSHPEMTEVPSEVLPVSVGSSEVAPVEATLEAPTLSGIAAGGAGKRERLQPTALLLGVIAVLLLAGAGVRALWPSSTTPTLPQTHAAPASSRSQELAGAGPGQAQAPVPTARERAESVHTAEPLRETPTGSATKRRPAQGVAGPTPRPLPADARAVPAQVSAVPPAVPPPPSASIDREF